MAMPATRAYLVELRGGGKLIIYTQSTEEIPGIACQTDALFQWMGVPKGFTLHLWWRHDPRIIESDEWPSRRNVNGGWTTLQSGEIFVYRQEEWERVVIHEIIHALGWDWHMPSRPLPCWGLSEDSILVPALFEAWTELYAEWLWCAFFGISWKTQRAWQDSQAIQILARAGERPWKENTNVFAYYVLKAALAPHIGFLWIYGNPKGDESVLCGLVERRLSELRIAAASVKPARISLRMTVLPPPKK